MSGSVQWWPSLPDGALPEGVSPPDAVCTIDLAGVSDKSGLLDAFAVALDAPAWAGRNWDALDELLRAGDADACLVLRDTRVLRRAERATWHTLLDVLADAVAFHAAAGRSLTVVVVD